MPSSHNADWKIYFFLTWLQSAKLRTCWKSISFRKTLYCCLYISGHNRSLLERLFCVLLLILFIQWLYRLESQIVTKFLFALFCHFTLIIHKTIDNKKSGWNMFFWNNNINQYLDQVKNNIMHKHFVWKIIVQTNHLLFKENSISKTIVKVLFDQNIWFLVKKLQQRRTFCAW